MNLVESMNLICAMNLVEIHKTVILRKESWCKLWLNIFQHLPTIDFFQWDLVVNGCIHELNLPVQRYVLCRVFTCCLSIQHDRCEVHVVFVLTVLVKSTDGPVSIVRIDKGICVAFAPLSSSDIFF